MKTIYEQEYEFYNRTKRVIIKEHLLECYENLVKGGNIDTLIKQHKHFINSFNLIGKQKNTLKTLEYLIQYKNTKNKSTALYNLTNTLNNLKLFSIKH